MRSGQQARTWTTALAAFVVLVSCRQVIGVEDREPPLRCDAPRTPLASCGACLAGTCCVELDACRADPACARYLDCAAPCTDDTCRTTCAASLGENTHAATLLACEAARCGDACGLVCGGAGSPIVGCQPCASACCADGTAFRADADGELLLQCRAKCADADIGCRERCVNAHAEGASLEAAAGECVRAACGVLSDWSCLGRTARGLPGNGPVSIGIQIIDVDTSAPLEGFTVKGCPKDDIACTAPFVSTVTNANGATRITVPANGGGGTSYRGFIELSRDDYVTNLLWFDPPVTTTTTLRVNATSKALLASISATSGVTVDPTRGFLALSAYDCSRFRAPGISFRVSSADAATRTGYLRGQVAGGPSLDFGATTTTDDGSAVLVNVPAGPTTITAHVDALCRDLTSTSVVVRANAATSIELWPER